MLQNATPLGKSAPGPPNSSDEHVSCTAPATEHASLQILFKCPTPAIVFGNATKTLTFCSLLTRSKRHLNVQKWSEHVVFFSHFDFEMCFRHNGVHFFDSATSKSVRSAPKLTCALYILTSLRTTACTFSTSQLPKVVRRMACFVHFDFEMCFAPQRRALFRHLNFQKWSRTCVFCAFYFFDIFPKVVRTCCALYILTSKRASRHNGVQFFISHLPSGSAPAALASLLFGPPGATNHWKNTVFRDFPTFSGTWIFFLLRLSLFDLLSSSLLFSSLLFFDSYHLCSSSVHIVGSLTSKLPSVNIYKYKNIKIYTYIKCKYLYLNTIYIKIHI